MVYGFGSLIGGYALGETANEQITYFDEYSDDKEDGTDKTTGKSLPFGSAASMDLLYPYGSIIMD